MYLMEQKADGKRFAATLNDLRSYSKALAEAKAHFARHSDAVALYLYNDDGSFIARTYTRGDNGEVGVLYGFHRFGITPPDLAPTPEEPKTWTEKPPTWTEGKTYDDCEIVLWWPLGRNFGKTATAGGEAPMGGPAGLEGNLAKISRLEAHLAASRQSCQFEHDERRRLAGLLSGQKAQADMFKQAWAVACEALNKTHDTLKAERLAHAKTSDQLSHTGSALLDLQHKVRDHFKL